MLPKCNNCGKEINGLAYKYNSIAEVNGKLVKGNDLLMCSKKCCMKYDSIAEKEIGTGFMCIRDSYYLDPPEWLKKTIRRLKNDR